VYIGGRSIRGGSIERFSSRVTDEEKGLRQFQLLYHDASPLVLFFWAGGACAACRKGFRILGENCLGSLGKEILWSVNLPSEGPVGIEFGRVNTRVMTAKIAIVPSRTAIRRGGIAGTGRPNILRCTGMVKDSKVAEECELITDAQSVKAASRRGNYRRVAGSGRSSGCWNFSSS
jgi:hypothetical protein